MRGRRIRCLRAVYESEFPRMREFFLKRYGFSLTDEQLIDFVGYYLPEKLDNKVLSYCQMVIPRQPGVRLKYFKVLSRDFPKWEALVLNNIYMPSEFLISAVIVMKCNHLYKEYV